MKNRIKSYLNNKKGMSLVEVLTAMTILTLVIFCFAPLFLTYLQSITIVGDRIDKINQHSATMQTVIGLNEGAGSYTTEVGNIPLALQADSGTSISRKGRGEATLGKSFSATLGKLDASNDEASLDGFKGNLLYSDLNVNENSIKDTFITVDGNSQSSGLSYYPTSLTDDFHEATITLISDGGLSFGTSLDGSDFDSSKIKVSVSNVGDLKENEDYEIKWVDKSIILITFYGGGDVCFENSPLLIKYGGYDCVVEIDAPMMIMVGEKALDDNYYYYVSRAELDDNGNLLVHRRVMESTDESGDKKAGAEGGDIILNSAMNDVEWVSAEDADALTWDKNGNGKKDAGEEGYGYYVMCGDNGQIRRFWKNSTTGNYYWGGDYTYYSDIELDRTGTNTMSYGLDGDDDKNGMTYSTSVSYKYYAHRDQKSGDDADGYNLATRDDGKGKLQSFNTFSVTALEDGKNYYFYGSDGKLLTFNQNEDGNVKYEQKLETDNGKGLNNFSAVYSAFKDATSKDFTYGFSTENGYNDNNTVNQLHKMAVVNFESYAWLKLDKDSYKNNFLTDVDSSIPEYSAPITLTSVGAIVLTNSGGAGYADSPNKKDQNYEVEYGGATFNSYLEKYPTNTYTLYAGYIPAVMDIWSSVSNTGNGLEGVIDTKNLAKTIYYDKDINSNLERLDKKIRDYSIQGIPHWKATIGITPYLTTSTSSNVTGEPNGFTNATSLKIDNTAQYIWHSSKGTKDCDSGKHNNLQAVYWPYTNINYALTGKFYDSKVDKSEVLFKDTEILPWRNYSLNDGKQQYMTAGQVVDITVSYLSHPFATHVAMNPTDLIVFDQANQKQSNRVFYWNNRRETVTVLDVASTKVANGEYDIPVSLAVGYVMGGMAEVDKSDNEIYPNTVMNNGIVLLRAGVAEIGKQDSPNSTTGEYYATDTKAVVKNAVSAALGDGYTYSAKANAGFKLNAESNYFHQFYYLHSSAPESDGNEPFRDFTGSVNYHIGNMYGAKYWQNNRHIDYVSMYGSVPYNLDPNAKYDYLRCHPMSNTKVTCVAWGTAWDGNPEAMWGTENGTVLSWKADLRGAETIKDGDNPSNYSERQVAAEIQSYKWIDNVNKKDYNAHTTSFANTVGSADPSGKTTVGTEFSVKNIAYKTFFDKGSQIESAKTRNMSYSNVGFINTLENINDIEYYDDIWIAVGDQSDKDPDDYCATGSLAQSDVSLKANGHRTIIKAYSNLDSGSWVNVRYWVDLVEDGENSQASDNSTYHWRAVKISDNPNCNIVQINNVNGMWIATGYIDGSNGGTKNDEYDEGEEACIFWTYDPLAPYGDTNGWSDAVLLYDGKDPVAGNLSAMGGINSCATRTVD